jgi:hypothetical protein
MSTPTQPSTPAEEAFQQFQHLVAGMLPEVGADQGEWGIYGNLVAGSLTINEYALNTHVLATNAQDIRSWTLVRDAGAAATSQDDVNAMTTILVAFLNITDPSHNAWAWQELQQLANNLLPTLQPTGHSQTP